MTEPKPNILGNLFGGMEDFGKLAESQKSPELDKLKPELDKLKKEVDVQKLRQAVEQENEMEIIAVLSPLEKLFKEVECPEAGFTDPDEINAKWLIMKEHIVNWLIEEREKEARQPIDDFINEVSTLTNFPTKKEEANEFAAKLKDTLQPRKLIFGSIIAALIKEADSMRDKDDGSDSFFGSILRSIADMLGGKDREKINALTTEMAAAIKKKDWELVEEKANALLEEDKDNKNAKKALALAEKKKAALAKKRKRKEEAEGKKPKYEKEIGELKGIVKTADIPVAIDEKEYKEVLGKIPGDDPEALKKVVEKGSQEKGGIWSLHKELQNHSTLKNGKFGLTLSDYLIRTATLSKAVKTLAGLPESPYKLPEDVTPNQLRDFLTALEKEEGLALYEKTEEEKKQDIPSPEKIADAGKKPGQDDNYQSNVPRTPLGADI